MSRRTIVLTGPDAASPQEALDWGRQAGLNEGAAMERSRLRDKVESLLLTDIRPPRAKEAYDLAVRHALALFDETRGGPAVSGPYTVESFGSGVTAEWGVRGPAGDERSPDWSRADAREVAAHHNRVHASALTEERSRLRKRVAAMRAEWADAGTDVRNVIAEVLALLAEPGEERT